MDRRRPGHPDRDRIRRLAWRTLINDIGETTSSNPQLQREYQRVRRLTFAAIRTLRREDLLRLEKDI